MKLLLPQRPPLQRLYFPCRHTTTLRSSKIRWFTNSSHVLERPPLPKTMNEFSAILYNNIYRRGGEEREQSVDEKNTILSTISQMKKPHRLHVYSHKHNTHITLSDGNRQPIISVSAGNIGFRKANRGSYDAAYQLGSYVMGRIKQRGLLAQIEGIELILRDFGQGREAIQKILLGTEGTFVRDKIVRVMDATRLKFGGVRSRRPRRLG